MVDLPVEMVDFPLGRHWEIDLTWKFPGGLCFKLVDSPVKLPVELVDLPVATVEFSSLTSPGSPA